MYDVIIIGAGISGLGAARVLTRESYNVLVLEARSRPGGRIHAVRMSSVEPTLLDSSTRPTNHDHLSIFHLDTDKPVNSTRPIKSSTSDSGESVCSETVPSKSDHEDSAKPHRPDFVDVDLGANYLIGCSNKQTDQPLFHMARLLEVPTATCVGDLCRKYRGWECAELAVWRNHRQPGAPIIPLTVIAEAAFLFDKVVHLAVHRHLKLKQKFAKFSNTDNDIHDTNEPYGTNEPSVKQFFEAALDSILQSEANFGLRPSAAFRDPVEASVFESIVMRYLTYVNPIDRLPHTVLDELCEVATPRWHLSINGSTLETLGLQDVPIRKLSLSDRLALVYPTAEQREAYHFWAERKLQALTSGQAGSSPSVARTVSVSWEDRLVTGRFSDLLRPLMDNVRIVYNAVVKSIDWDAASRPEGGVIVRVIIHRSSDLSNFTSEQKSESEELMYHAKHCIVTVPVGVLKGLDHRSSISFHPELPSRKREAINRLGPPFRGAPTHEKVILRFRDPEHVFWDSDAAHLKCTDPRLHILNLHRYGKPGVLCAHIWGGSGLCPAGKSDQAIVDVILTLLDQMYPSVQFPRRDKQGVPEPIDYIVTRWCEDPFALGAYTTGEPGSSDADRLAYAASLTDEDARGRGIVDSQHTQTKSCPRLLFAGEGTLTASEAKECTHGALQTGVIRALDLLPYLNSKVDGLKSSGSPNRSDRAFARSMDSTRTLILNKLAHYLIGRPQIRWLANLSSLGAQRPDRKNSRITSRSTVYPVNEPNSVRSKFSEAFHLKMSGTSIRRRPPEESQSDDEDSSSSARKTTNPTVRSNRRTRGSGIVSGRRVTGRGFSTAARTSVLSGQPKRARRVWKGVVRRRRQPATIAEQSQHSTDSQSETSSATIEARLSSSSSWSPEHQTQVTITRFMSSFQQLSDSWHLFSPSNRQQVLTDLVGLVDELHSRHVLLDTVGQPSSEVQEPSPAEDPSLHVAPPDNPVTQFPFLY